MPIRPMSAAKKTSRSPSGKKNKKTAKNDDPLIDPHQEEINGLIREREEIRSKLNDVCRKLIENVQIDDDQFYRESIDLTRQQPSDLSLEKIFHVIDEICFYRLAFLNLFQEIDDEKNKSVHEKITQLARDQPEILRKRLTAEQRLSFVIRERDLWKENAQALQMMYATIVDQLEMGLMKKINRSTEEILHSHRLNLEDVCRIFSAPRLRSIAQPEKLPPKERRVDSPSTPPPSPPPPVIEQREPEKPVVKRNVSFAEHVDVMNEESDDQQMSNDSSSETESISPRRRRPLADETSVEEMDSNLRMLIIKELSKNAYLQRPPSRMSLMYNPSPSPITQHRSLEWVELARIVGIRESEIEHWLSQSLQYPAGRVISTWCHSKSPPPTVADLHRLLASNALNRTDLMRSIEQIYRI